MIGLIQNVRTGSISPQFHVVYDDGFTTVPSHLTDDHIKPEDWKTLLMFNRMLSIDPDELYELNEEWLSEQDQEEQRQQKQQYHWNVATAPTIR